jgi:hypothetical protein
MITITDTMSITMITIAKITISACPNAHTYAHNPLEATSRHRWKI